jgi:hypothetical protein
MQGLTPTDLCVSVAPATASIQAGGTATFTVTVWVENGLTADVTVKLSSGATYTSGCPDGDGSASCWIASMNVLGSVSSVQMQVQEPAAAGAASVPLSATASVPTLLPWTPPSAASSVAVIAPAATATASPTPAKTTQTPSPTTTRSAPAARHTSSATTAPAAQHSTAPTTQTVGAGPTLPPIPLPSLPGSGQSVVNPGSASGLFPTISASPSPSSSAQGEAAEIPAEATGYQVPLAPAGLVIAILIALGGAGLGGRQLYQWRRDGKK